MQPVDFKGANRVYGAGQPEYLPLPAYTSDPDTLTCWALTWRERFKVLLTGRIWVWQKNFGKPIDPLFLQTETPFHEDVCNELLPNGERCVLAAGHGGHWHDDGSASWAREEGVSPPAGRASNSEETQ